MAMVQCVKLGREAEGLDRPPFPNALGKRIHESVSKEGFSMRYAIAVVAVSANATPTAVGPVFNGCPLRSSTGSTFLSAMDTETEAST